MSRAGRKPKPTHLKVIQGNPGKRALPKGEPKPLAGKPTCPSHLDAEAKREWRRMVRDLEAMGLLTKVDRAALALYCQAWARWVKAVGQIEAHGEVVETGNGSVKLSPWVTVANTASKEMRALLVEFGLTPSSRSRVSVPTQEEEDPLAAFVRKRSS